MGLFFSSGRSKGKRIGGDKFGGRLGLRIILISFFPSARRFRSGNGRERAGRGRRIAGTEIVAAS